MSDTPVDQRILEMAAEHIRRHGVARTTIVGIAEDSGMSHANVYRHYPSKIALLDEVTAAWLKPLEAQLRVIGDAPDPAYDKLERILFAVHRAYRDKLDNDSKVFGLFVAAVESGRGVARKHRNKLQSEIQRVLEEGAGGGVFQIADQRRALALVFDAMHRFTHPVTVQMDKDAPRAALEARAARVAGLVIRALAGGKF